MQKKDKEAEVKRLVALVGANIRAYRKDANMTQEKLSELAGVNEKHLSAIENGRESNLSIGYIVSVALALGVSFADLVKEGR